MLIAQELSEPRLKRFALSAFDGVDRPEQQAVFVLDLDDRHARVVPEGNAGVGILRQEQLAQPCLVGVLQRGVEEQQAPGGLRRATGDSPRGCKLHRPCPVRRERGVDTLGAHGGNGAPDAFAFSRVDVGDRRMGVGRQVGAQLAVQPDHVDAAFGQEACMACEIGRYGGAKGLAHEWVAAHFGIHRPKPNRRAVAAHEADVSAHAHEAGFAGLPFVQ